MFTRNFNKATKISLLSVGMLLFMSCSLKMSESDATNPDDLYEEDPYEDVEPLINGDSLFQCYPYAGTNPAHRIRMEKAMLTHITKQIGNRLPSIEIVPFTCEKVHPSTGDSARVLFVSYKYNVRVSAVLPKEEAQKLSTDSFYRIGGTFTGFPDSKTQRPQVTGYREIDLGVLEYENLTFTDFPESELDYFFAGY